MSTADPREEPGEGKATRRLEARRQAMLDAAAQLFFEMGYERTSVNEIVRRSGGSLSTLYQLFGSKEGLFEVMVQERCAAILEPLTTPDLPAKPPLDALRALGLRFMQVIYCPDALALVRTVHGEGLKFPGLAESYFRNGPDFAIAKVAEYLGDLHRRGLIHCPDPLFAASAFYMTLHGELFFRVLAGTRPIPTAEEILAQVERAVDLFWRSVEPRPGNTAG
ncbi:MAG: hypothetical protein RLY86_2806 [Pseudomonadota bacterium]|jgi:AcrR family transcriptional regulator